MSTGSQPSVGARRAAGPDGGRPWCPQRLGVTLDDSLITTLPTVGALVDLVAEQKA